MSHSIDCLSDVSSEEGNPDSSAFYESDSITPVYYYPRMFPKIDELVTAQIKNIDDLGITCSLLEYGNIDAFVSLSEISRKRVRSVNKIVRVGQKHIFETIRVDETKGYVDLSKSKITEIQRINGNEKYVNSRKIHEIVKMMSYKSHISVETLYEDYIWNFYDDEDCKTPYDAFVEYIKTDENIWLKAEINIENETKNNFESVIRNRLGKINICCKKYLFNVENWADSGIDGIKQALNEGKKYNTKTDTVEIVLIRSPTYRLILQSIDEKCLEILKQNVITAIKTDIEKSGGIYYDLREVSKDENEIEKEIFNSGR